MYGWDDGNDEWDEMRIRGWMDECVDMIEKE